AVFRERGLSFSRARAPPPMRDDCSSLPSSTCRCCSGRLWYAKHERGGDIRSTTCRNALESDSNRHSNRDARAFTLVAAARGERASPANGFVLRKRSRVHVGESGWKKFRLR